MIKHKHDSHCARSALLTLSLSSYVEFRVYILIFFQIQS